MIKDFSPRLYQETIFATASRANTLIVLPTGMGKTNIFLMLAAHRLRQHPGSKILLIGPTRPLIDQYREVFLRHFDISEDQMALFTGLVSPKQRAELWKSAKVVFSTPQGLENDLISSRISLKDVSLLGVDEAHRAVGDYSYVFIAKKYHESARFERIVGMTASPGSELEKINEVLANLFIEEIEIRSDESPDVSSYIQELRTQFVKVKLPEEFKSIIKDLESCYRSKLLEIKKLGYLDSADIVGRKEILGLQARLQGELAQGTRDYQIMRSVSLAAEALKVHHALELVETQGIGPAKAYLHGIDMQARTSKTKAVQNLVRDTNFRSALVKAEILQSRGIEHPKLAKLCEIVSEQAGKGVQKTIVFTQFRDTGAKIVSLLEKAGIRSILFVGQAKKNGSGLTQKRQIEILSEFRSGSFEVLVSSSVGEEGLDIPEVDSVIFYEPIPSAIRSIQRRGRTARMKEGTVVVLVAEGTRDEAYRWTAHHREKKMQRTLEGLKRQMVLRRYETKSQEKTGAGVRVYADYREKGGAVIKELIESGCDMKLERLNVGDYVLSPDCGVEYKTVRDFVDSLVDGRLLSQVRELRENFRKPLMLVEGTADIFSVRNVHPNAIRGLLATIAVSYRVPILFTRSPRDTAATLVVVARREQEESGKDFSLHGSKKPMALHEQQEYIVTSLPGVGPGLAKELLRTFGSVRAIVNATEEELEKTPGIGKARAMAIIKAVTEKYS